MTELKKRDRGMERATNITRQKPRTIKNSEAQENTKHKDQDNFYQRNKPEPNLNYWVNEPGLGWQYFMFGL